MTSDLTVVKRVIVLGGGSAGFMAALALKVKMPDLAVVVIRSRDIGIIGVGEGSTVNLTAFLHRYLSVNPKTFYQIAQPTWKLGLRFRWGKRPHFYYPFDAMQLVQPRPELAKPPGFYCDAEMDGADLMSAMMALNRVFGRTPKGEIQFHNNFSYHFENDKFVAFLEAFAQSAGIQIVEDTVGEVRQDESGITGLLLKSGRIETADLYVDSSGFASLLLGKALGEPFSDFKSSLFCDRAIVGGWERQGEAILPFTSCDTMNAGWCWQIEHIGRINRGYVYCSSFISDEEAEREFRAVAPKVGPSRIVRFVTGRYERNFVKNVVAIGNANGFVEPLEATALGMIAVQSRLLADSLSAADRQIRNTYRNLINRQHKLLWDSTRGFISIHYKFNDRLDTPFWQECRAKADISAAAGPVEYYQENGPDGFFGSLVVGEHDPFAIGGWVNLLLGQRVPYKHHHHATDTEKQAFTNLRERHFQMAKTALTTEEILAMVRSPQWRW
jgi:tryptophan halogenase